jgi:CRISPR-associated protein Csb1
MNVLDVLKGARAVLVTETVVSPSPSIKLPSYAAEKENKDKTPQFVVWGGNTALVDSVQSQANRIETVFTEYPDLVPATTVKYPDTTIALVEVPNRSADPAIAYYFREELDALATKPELLAKRAPTSLIFGICDIRNGRSIKLTRAISAEIVARNCKMRPAGASLSTPFSVDTRAQLTSLLEGSKGSAIGVEQVVAWSEKGTVDVTEAVITRTITLSLDVLNQYKRIPALYNYLLGIALIAILAPPTSTVLRSGTTLIRKQRKVEIFRDLKPEELVSEDGLFDEVLEFARQAAVTFGIGEAEELTVDIDKIIAEASEGKAKKANKKKAAAAAGGSIESA